MKRIYCIAMLLIALGSCKPGIPKGIIEPDKMAAVLYDIHVADGYVGTIPLQDSAKKVASAYYRGVYKKFGVDSAAVNNSLTYYTARPEVFTPIYNKVTTSLKKSKDSLDKIVAKKAKLKGDIKRKAEKKTRDSLAKVKSLKQKPADIRKAKLDSLKKLRTSADSLKRVNAGDKKKSKIKRESLMRVRPKGLEKVTLRN